MNHYFPRAARTALCETPPAMLPFEEQQPPRPPQPGVVQAAADEGTAAEPTAPVPAAADPVVEAAAGICTPLGAKRRRRVTFADEAEVRQPPPQPQPRQPPPAPPQKLEQEREQE